MFPIDALTLVNRAYERVFEQSETVKQQLVSAYLPQTVEVILSRQPECREIVKGRPGLQKLCEELGQILWSHPGSMGGVRVERTLIDAGFSADEADVLATNVIQYSRYSMAVVNHLRHVRSAITGLRDVLVLQMARVRFFSQSELHPELELDWFAYIEKLGARVLEDAEDLTEWLDDMSIVLATLLRAKNQKILKTSPSELASFSNEKIKFGLGPLSIAQAYTRRFGRFVRQEFNIEDLGGRYETREESILDELAKLKNDLSGDDKHVFELFSEDYDKRKSRIKVSTRPPASRALSNQGISSSYFEKMISNHLRIDNRELIVRNSSGKISHDLIDQMYKLYVTQLKVEPNLEKFIGKTIANGQFLEVEFHDPAAKDAAKLKRYLETLFD